MPEPTAPSSSPMPNIARAGAIMMVSLFLSRVLGIGRELIILWRFGQNDLTSAYVLSFQIPDLIFFLLAGGALSSAFIPVFTEYLHTNREKEAWHIFSVVTTVVSVFIAGVIIIAFIAAPPLTAFIAQGEGMDPSFYPLITTMSRILLPAQFAFLVGALMIGTLYARQQFTAPALAPNIYNLGIIFGALVLSTLIPVGVIGMSIGALIGALIGSFLIPLLIMRRLGSFYRFSFDLQHPGVRRVFSLMIPVVLGLSLPALYAMLMRTFGTFYPIEGLPMALDFANKMMQAPVGIFGQALALAAFPALSQFFAQQNMGAYRTQLVRTLGTTFFLALPVTAVLVILPGEILWAIVQYGAFTESDRAITEVCLRFFAIGTAAWCLHPVLMRAFFAIQNSWIPTVLGTITTGVFIGLVFYGLERFAFGWLPLAGSLSAYVLVIMLFVALQVKIGGFNFRELFTSFMGTILCVLAASVILVGFKYLAPLIVDRIGQIGLLGGLTLSLLLFGVVYLALARALHMQEVAYVDRALKKRRNRESSLEDPSDPSNRPPSTPAS